MKILIFYGSYGGGHLSAARYIKEYFESNYNNNEVFIVDAIKYVNKALNKVTTKAYSDMAKKAGWAWKKLYYNSEKTPLKQITNETHKAMAIKLNKLLQEISPDLIISTHPFSSHMCAYLKKKGKINCKIATILTDYAPHGQWLMYPEFINYFFVAHEGMKDSLISEGIEENKIFATGIPLSNRFLAHYDKKRVLSTFGLSENKKTILFFAGGKYGLGKDNTYKILKSLVAQFSNMQIIAISGKNSKIRKQFEEIASEGNSSNTVRILSYTNKVPELMSVSDLVITKPGGLTTTESLASGLPIIVINPIPGQEEENAMFLEQKKVAVWIKKNDNIEEKLFSILNSPETLKSMKINARLLAKKNSTKDICEILMGEI
ncbi:MAG: glycosyltransferase [Clostridiales bacterium]|nr:glycosyltransferase [Clostridiales bacterium]